MSVAQKGKRIPFKVSARTARLIGRENIATSKGAIIELVKNGYDADSSVSLVYFDNEFSLLHDQVDKAHYDSVLEKINQIYIDFSSKKTDQEVASILDERDRFINLYSSMYTNDAKNNYKLDSGSDSNYKELKSLLRKLATVYIIDNGEGMTSDIISNHWMVIGTDNKKIIL